MKYLVGLIVAVALISPVAANDLSIGAAAMSGEINTPNPNDRRTQAASVLTSCVEVVGYTPAGETIVEVIDCPVEAGPPAEEPTEDYPEKE